MTQDRRTQSVRLLLADDHAILRKSLRMLLEQSPNLTVVADCKDGREAVMEAARLRPEIVLMDIGMPGLNGIEAIKRIKQDTPTTRIIVVSGYGDRDRLRQAVAAGASGFVVKRSDLDELLLAIKTVRGGNTYFSTDLVESIDIGEVIYEAKHASRTSGGTTLSPREREVLQLVAEGHTAKSIAKELVITEKTVETHKANIMQKVGAKNRSDLIRYALRIGLVELHPDVPDSEDDDPQSAGGALA